MSKILKCKCTHKFQDEEYGKSKRVFNKCKNDNPSYDVYRCSVCQHLVEIKP